ncbi:MAG: zf-HC2 domain-containing protein [Myxococcaceae bacterium]|nr:zf-HC2 domain-containing protein [Myxococcaceae bacterium]
MSVEKLVAGLKCFEVLARLSDYLDGDLPAADKAQVEAHLAGCDECTRFGGEFGQVVTSLRQTLGVEADAPSTVARKLDEALSR